VKAAADFGRATLACVDSAEAPSLATLASLAASERLRDRALVASEVRRRWRAAAEPRLGALDAAVRETADRVHAATRGRIRSGEFDRAALLAEVAALPIDVRDHHVEEILGVAYPPLPDAASPREIFHVAPSGLTEILFALDALDEPGRSFVDLGSGCGKAVLLAALLTGAQATGLELDPALVDHARAAAKGLGLDPARATFVEADLRRSPLPSADVYYMYIPFVGSAEVVARLAPIARARPIRLFSQALDLQALPWLRARGEGSYWLESYEAGPT
jgi:hypothetical protein